MSAAYCIPPGKPVKLVVWDLDDTLWRGTLLERDALDLASEVRAIVHELDARGILQSIASRNEPEPALAELARQGFAEMFLLPQIGWGAKSSAVAAIVGALNIGLDSVLFIDDQAFEREEVVHALPQVRTIDPERLPRLLDDPLLTPEYRTPEASRRRQMYLEDFARGASEKEFAGPQAEFLAGLQLRLTLADATVDDLHRAEELVLRTNQLNSTGVTYSFEELAGFLSDPTHRLLAVALADRFGDYGKIGLALLRCDPDAWRLKLLIVSCRVMSRGTGQLVLTQLMRMAKAHDVRFEAEYRPTGRNRQMLVTYKFAGLAEIAREAETLVLAHSLDTVAPLPEHVEFVSQTALARARSTSAVYA